MIQIFDKQNCCGCSACASICPKQCITMQEDNEGFLYPILDVNRCIDCHLCENVCHELNSYTECQPIKVLSAINKNDDIRKNSSSGGVFYLLAEKTILEGGVVFGARFDENWQVVIDYAEDLRGIESFMGSKYVQARIESAYTDAKRFLCDGRKVLFSGTPCQITGLHHYLRKQYENLLTVDIICHGAPSPKVWSTYLDEVVTTARKSINDIHYRNKSDGRKSSNYSMSYNKDEQSISLCIHPSQNLYMKAFLQDMILRPSCQNCQAKGGRSNSDITLADFWGVDKEMPDMDDNKGTSLILVKTLKGQSFIDLNKIILKETSSEVALRYNPAYYRSVNFHPKRKVFFENLDNTKSICKLIDDCLRPSFKQRIRLSLSSFKHLLIRILKYTFGKDKTLEISYNNIPSMSNKVSISSIHFRDKSLGWKSYRMVIKLKEEQK